MTDVCCDTKSAQMEQRSTFLAEPRVYVSTCLFTTSVKENEYITTVEASCKVEKSKP